jgi:hypothetical protein
MLGISVQLSLSQLAKMLFLIIVYTLSSTKLEIRAEQILPDSGVGGNGPNNEGI